MLRWEENIKMGLKETGYDVDWIQLAHNRVQWRALVNTAMNLRVPERRKICLAERFLASQDVLCSMSLSV
jgi:hypothetical protein